MWNDEEDNGVAVRQVSQDCDVYELSGLQCASSGHGHCGWLVKHGNRGIFIMRLSTAASTKD